MIRDFAPGHPKHGYVIAQGSSATFNLGECASSTGAGGINVKVISAISEELFDRQPEAYRNAVLPAEARQDLMFVSTGLGGCGRPQCGVHSPMRIRSLRIGTING